jgi:GAF domain-containing protein
MYTDLKKKVSHLISSKKVDTYATLTSVCEVLKEGIPYYDWVGFYFANPEAQTLHLKAFAGKPTEHTVIPFGKGICGQVAVSNENFVVPDVTSQDNYISCGLDIKSEIVVPLFKDGQNIGQIDIDSHAVDPFIPEDERFLEWVNEQVAKIL